MRHAFCVVTILALAACGAGGGSNSPGPVQTPTPVSQSAKVTLPLSDTGVALALPPSNGYICTLVIPANDAPTGATILVTVPVPGAVPQATATPAPSLYEPVSTGISPPTTSPQAEITLTASAAVTFVSPPAPSCNPATTPIVPASAAYAYQYIDPTNPGSVTPPTISAGTTPSPLFVPAGTPIAIAAI